METAHGSLTILNSHMAPTQVFWNGVKVEGIKRVHVHADEDENRVKLVVTGSQTEMYAQMEAAGINVKKVAA